MQVLCKYCVGRYARTEYCTMPILGCSVVNGYGATLGTALDRARSSDDLPACAKKQQRMRLREIGREG